MTNSSVAAVGAGAGGESALQSTPYCKPCVLLQAASGREAEEAPKEGRLSAASAVSTPAGKGQAESGAGR
jgi:hypothetical protein